MAARAGIEPVLQFLQLAMDVATSEIAKTTDTQIRTQKLRELRMILAAWPNLGPQLRAAMVALAATA